MATYLITPEEVFDAMGQNPDMMSDSVPAIESAILRATIKLEGIMGMVLRPEQRIDSFCISGVDGSPLNGRYSLFLSNGFVSKDDPVSVVLSSEEYGSYSEASNYSVSYVDGKVHIPCGNPDALLGSYVQVSYSCGLSSKVPDEIKQALLCFVPSMLMSTSTAQVEPKAQAAQASKQSSLDTLGADMVARYIKARRPGNCIKAMNFTVVE